MAAAPSNLRAPTDRRSSRAPISASTPDGSGPCEVGACCLLEEQRVAARAPHYRLPQFRRGLFSKEQRRELERVVSAERREFDDLAGQLARLVPSRGREDEQRGLDLCERREQVEQGRLGPVHVLDNQHRRRSAGP